MIQLLFLCIENDSLNVSFSSFSNEIQSERTRRKIDKIIRYNSMMQQRVGDTNVWWLLLEPVIRASVFPGVGNFATPRFDTISTVSCEDAYP